MIQLFGRLPNPDKNFIREFQTEGFDSRVWELYLFGLSQQVGLQATRPHDRPDFLFTRNGVSVWLEAVTSHAGKDVAPMIPDDVRQVWQTGNASGAFSLKLCGAGGGGVFLGLAQDSAMEKVEIDGDFPCHILHI